MNSTKQAIRAAFPRTIPVLVGYLFLGSGFGILLSKSGYNFLWATFTSATVYSGSMQYVAVDLLNAPFNITTAIVMTIAVNIRHIFYGLSLIEKYKDLGKYKFYSIFGLTDETYSIVCSQTVPETIDKNKFYFYTTLFCHIYWMAGCTLGGLIGQYIDFNAKGIEFVMTSLFVVIFIEQWEGTKKHGPALIGVLCSLASLIICRTISPALANFFLIPSMILIFIAISLGRNRLDEKENVNKEIEGGANL